MSCNCLFSPPFLRLLARRIFIGSVHHYYCIQARTYSTKPAFNSWEEKCPYYFNRYMNGASSNGWVINSVCDTVNGGGHLLWRFNTGFEAVYFQRMRNVFQGSFAVTESIYPSSKYTVVGSDPMDTCLSNGIFQCLSNMYVAKFIKQHTKNICRRTWNREY